MRDPGKVAAFLDTLHKIIFLQDDGFNRSMVRRSWPIGSILSLVFSLIMLPNIFGVAMFIVLLIYATLYSTFFYFSIRSGSKAGTNFPMMIDNVLLSFFFALLVCMIATAMIFPFFGYFFGYNYINSLTVLVFGLTFFFYNLKLSVSLLHDPDLDHVFNAQMVPFLFANLVVYYTMNHSAFPY